MNDNCNYSGVGCLPSVSLPTHLQVPSAIPTPNGPASPLPTQQTPGTLHTPMAASAKPIPYTVKVMGYSYETTVGSLAYYADQAAYTLLPSAVGVSLGGTVSAGQTPVGGQGGSNASAACNWRSGTCGTFQGYQFSGALGVIEGASGSFEAGLFTSFGGSDVDTVAGPNHIGSIDANLVPGVGINASLSGSISVDPKTESLAVDPNSNHYITTYGISAGFSAGAEVEISVSGSPAYLPGIPGPLNNTWRTR